MAEVEPRAIANPTKQFFVNMITRDISLEDSILDLIDNSVDSAWTRCGGHPMNLSDKTDLSPYAIQLEVSPSRFSIVDDCGGMSLDDAVHHAFSFGRPATQEDDEYSIGVYGIGMKRAVFKLGREVRIRSTVAEDDGTETAFLVPIDVEEWLKSDDPPWDFDIDDAEHLARAGVEIVVESLTSAARTSFGNPRFIENLRRVVARDYSLHLERGLSISINDRPLKGVPIELREGEAFAPMRVSYVEGVAEDEVTVEIIGGMAAPPPETAEPDEAFDGDRRYGWYIACNGRIVLAADKTTVSGWGSPDWPQWHRQYSGFLGIVLFSARHAAALPLTTTKRSVDVTSEVFLRARPRMRELSRQWIDYTNERKQALEEAKAREQEAVAVPIRAVTARPSATLPKLVVVRGPRVANVNYSVPRARMRKLANAFGRASMSYRDVGISSFDYAYDDLVEED